MWILQCAELHCLRNLLRVPSIYTYVHTDLYMSLQYGMILNHARSVRNICFMPAAVVVRPGFSLSIVRICFWLLGNCNLAGKDRTWFSFSRISWHLSEYRDTCWGRASAGASWLNKCLLHLIRSSIKYFLCERWSYRCMARSYIFQHRRGMRRLRRCCRQQQPHFAHANLEDFLPGLCTMGCGLSKKLPNYLMLSMGGQSKKNWYIVNNMWTMPFWMEYISFSGGLPSRIVPNSRGLSVNCISLFSIIAFSRWKKQLEMKIDMHL